MAPVFNPEGRVPFYLPAGKWTSLVQAGEFYEVAAGGQWLTKDYDELYLRVLVRDNTILVLGKQPIHAAYDYTKDVTIHVFDLHTGETAVSVVNQQG